MKNILTIIFSLFYFIYANCQVTTAGMGSEFKEISGFGRVQSGFEGIQTYNTGSTKGSEFFYDNWATGSVTTLHNEVLSKNYLFIFDKIRQQLFIKENNSDPTLASYKATRGTEKFAKPKSTDIVMLADKDQMASFTINTDRPHVFEPVVKYDPKNKQDFFEVLTKINNCILLKLTTTSFEKNSNDMEKVKQGNFADEFIDHITYYLYQNNKLEKLTLKESSLRKALKGQEQKVDDFFNYHQNDEITESLAIDLINTVMANS